METVKSTKIVLLKLDPNNYKVKTNNEGKRMKIHIKFNPEDSESYKNWMVNIKPANMSTDEFAKVVFQKGIQAIHQESERRLNEYLEEHPEEKEKFIKGLKEIAKEENVDLTVSS